MTDFNKLRKILNGSNMSVKHYANGRKAITDSQTFRGMNLSALEEAQGLVEEAIKEDTVSYASKSGIQLDSLKSASDRARENVGTIMGCLISDKNVSAKEIHDKVNIRDSFLNGRWNTGNIVDPTKASFALPNIYISEVFASRNPIFSLSLSLHP